jgi:hypothetical protein
MNFGTDSIGDPETWSGTLCGVMLLMFFLVFDSFTGQWQSRMFHKHEDLTPVHMMLLVNTFSLIFSMITLVHTKVCVWTKRIYFTQPSVLFIALSHSSASVQTNHLNSKSINQQQPQHQNRKLDLSWSLW